MCYRRFDEGFTPEQKQQAKEVKRSCNLNLAAAQLKLGNAVEARKAADKVRALRRCIKGKRGNGGSARRLALRLPCCIWRQPLLPLPHCRRCWRETAAT